MRSASFAEERLAEHEAQAAGGRPEPMVAGERLGALVAWRVGRIEALHAHHLPESHPVKPRRIGVAREEVRREQITHRGVGSREEVPVDGDAHQRGDDAFGH